MFTPPDRVDNTLGTHVGKVTSIKGKYAFVKFTGNGRAAWSYGPCRIPDHISAATKVEGKNATAYGDFTTVTPLPLLVDQLVAVHINREGAYILGRY